MLHHEVNTLSFLAGGKYEVNLSKMIAGIDLDSVSSRVQTAKRSMTDEALAYFTEALAEAVTDEALAYFTEGKRVFKEPRCLHYTVDGVQAPGLLRKI